MIFYNSLVLVDSNEFKSIGLFFILVNILMDEYAKIAVKPIIDFILISLDLAYMYCCNNNF